MAEQQEAAGAIPQDIPQPPPVKGESQESQEQKEETPSLNALVNMIPILLNRFICQRNHL